MPGKRPPGFQEDPLAGRLVVSEIDDGLCPAAVTSVISPACVLARLTVPDRAEPLSGRVADRHRESPCARQPIAGFPI